MRWIVGAGADIAVDSNQLQARREYIRDVTDADVSGWNSIQKNGRSFLYCISADSVDGIFITAHREDILMLCSLREACSCKFVVANTCIWEGMTHKDLLRRMMRYNSSIDLLFAKQELSVINRIFRKTTTIKYVGRFEFQTSRSERELFRNRKNGLETAIWKSFERVSPIIFPEDIL